MSKVKNQMKTKQTSIHMNPSKIIGIQFGLMSPEQILKSSVAEIVSKDTYINNKPVVGGIFDPRMGILEPGLLCPTDGLNYIQSPGYFGHIKLVKPVFYIQYFTQVLKILRCICFKCSKLLLEKDEYQHLLDIPSKSRWDAVFEVANKQLRCGSENHDGCGYRQPNKIKREGIASIVAEWKLTQTEGGGETTYLKITPEMVVKVFKRISDDDVNFMGFSSVFARPEWMVCEVLAVPPPCVRPSVKHDAQQRSEDDLSHIIISIIKANNGLRDKLKANAKENIIDDMTMFLQYNVATLVNNKIPGSNPVAQRSSGRLLKSITDRLNGKTGRIRGNLMGKRVDYSARSVITGDPNLSIRELGVPLKIAMNITYPAIVNKRNIGFLKKLLFNGPEVYPGSKILQRKTGDEISLRYVDRSAITLEEGDILHRHILDGDAVLFNRQPTLHRMSMMCHVVKVMYEGNTFRLNVADTKPYNADFDGDEMNMHMPQNPEAAMELRYLAAVPRQIISPAKNSSIIGIFQDSLLGLFRFTRDKTEFSAREAMNLLMNAPNVSPDMVKPITKNTDIMSQILPPLSAKMANNLFDDKTESYATSNNVIEIVNGIMRRGQINKNVSILIQSIFNDFGFQACSDFIDELQAIVTEYMKTSSYSVGVSDLIANKTTNDKINEIITHNKQRVNDILNEVLVGAFHNNTSRSNEEEVETKINDILNKAREEAGSFGRKSLDKDNRFVIMVNAGSKGSNINIAQMISCLGQQNIDNKRIPYGFEDRTLPHFEKFDDSAEARGFVESSFIEGLNPQEFWFHAMGGREGLIDTAVKTANTGYIQRKLIKSMEDLKVEYDMTVRTNNRRVVQFRYGDDGVETTKIETQKLPLLTMSLDSIYAHYHINVNEESDVYKTTFTEATMKRLRSQQEKYNKSIQERINRAILVRDNIMNHMTPGSFSDKIHIPVNFRRIIETIRNQLMMKENVLVNVSPMECLDIIDKLKDDLNKIRISPPTDLFMTVLDFNMTPRELLFNKRYTKKGLDMLCVAILSYYKKAIVSPGEMVGMIAAQSIGEPTTQMSEIYDRIVRVMVIKDDGSKKHKTVKIGELCDEFIEKYPQYTFPTGHENSVETLLDKLDENYYIMSVDKQEKTSWSRISHFSRHPPNGGLITIKTRSGRKTTTTLSHSHLTRRNHQVLPIKGSELKVGIRVPICKHIDNDFVLKEVKIGDTVYELNEQFGWFIGAYLAEGNCNGNTIVITNIDEHYINSTMAIAELFKCNGNTYTREGEYGPSTKTSFNHKELAKFLLEHAGENSFKKKVPEFMFMAPNVCKGAMLQGYMDGDGNINCDETHHEIRGCSRSEQLILDIGQLFNYFDIFVHFSECVRDKKPLYNFNISACYADQYKTHIGSMLKMDKLKGICDYVKRDDAYNLSNNVDKIEGLGDIIATCGEVLKLPGQSRNYGRWKKKNSIGRRTLEKYIGVFKESIGNQDILKNEMELLEQACYSDIVWDEIIDIEIDMSPEDKYVYDFTVPGNQTFMEANGLLVHNTLNTFHFAGVSSKSNVTRGVPRMEEILSLSSNPKNPSVTVFLKEEEETNRNRATQIRYMMENTKLRDITSSISICFDPDDMNTLVDEDRELIQQYKEFESMVDECLTSNNVDMAKESYASEKEIEPVEMKDDDEEEKSEEEKDSPSAKKEAEASKYVIRFEMNKEEMLEQNISMDDVHFALQTGYKDEFECVYSDYNSNKLILRVRLSEMIKKKDSGLSMKIMDYENKSKHLDQSDEIFMLRNIENYLLDNIILKGVKDIDKVYLRKLAGGMMKENGEYKTSDTWVLDTVGTNLLDILALPYIDFSKTYSNDIIETYNVLGIEATRDIIQREIIEVLEYDGSYINTHHVGLLADRMCLTSRLISTTRHGINNDDIGPIAKASFEETPEMLLRAARHAEVDTLRGVSSNIMCGQDGNYGTSAFNVYLDMEQMMKSKPKMIMETASNIESMIQDVLGEENIKDDCAKEHIMIDNSHKHIRPRVEDSVMNDVYNPGF